MITWDSEWSWESPKKRRLLDSAQLLASEPAVGAKEALYLPKCALVVEPMSSAARSLCSKTDLTNLPHRSSGSHEQTVTFQARRCQRFELHSGETWWVGEVHPELNLCREFWSFIKHCAECSDRGQTNVKLSAIEEIQCQEAEAKQLKESARSLLSGALALNPSLNWNISVNIDCRSDHGQVEDSVSSRLVEYSIVRSQESKRAAHYSSAVPDWGDVVASSRSSKGRRGLVGMAWQSRMMSWDPKGISEVFLGFQIRWLLNS